MLSLKYPLFTVAASLMLCMVYADKANAVDDISTALSQSKVSVQLRARYETVDQDGVSDTADALTLKSRLTLITGSLKGVSLTTEVDNVTALIEDYNNTINGKSHFPVVADPEGTDINLASLQYKFDKVSVTAGRQRILHKNQRFVGGVGWRQNEQTYDGYRLQYALNAKISFDYSYVHNINRIFGPNSAKADLKGAFHLVNTTYQLAEKHQLSGFVYMLDFDTAAALSTSTYGITYKGAFGAINVNATVASQTDNGNNPNNFDTSYFNAEISSKLGPFVLLAGFEDLGSDNEVGFSTPLATLHKFQGFADKFLATPANGIQDLYLTGKTKISNIALSATIHNLSSSEGDVDYGTEIDFTAAYKINKNYKVLLKWAEYSADEHATDTSKLWLQLAAKY
ncbi:MAG: alginate export family protein [Colwellia sp.]|nr:alginate export family protein [Colwellia sp.]